MGADAPDDRHRAPEAPDAADHRHRKRDELPSEAEARAANESANEKKIYSYEFLYSLKNLPVCKTKPECLSRPGVLAIGCWKRVGDSLGDENVNSKNLSNDKKRPGDPRERLRKESEGIVLSPQRRSFTSGCFVVTGNINNTRLRPDSPLFNSDQKNDIGPRDVSRRSGRVIPWERGGDNMDDPLNGSDFIPYRPPGAQRERGGDDRYERRSYQMYSEKRNDREMDRYQERRGNRYDKRKGYDKDEEPEWFSGGPTSQNETIELRGFDEPSTNASTAAPTTASTTTTVTNAGGSASTVTTSTETATTRTRPTRRSAGSGRTPSAMAANQPKEIPPNVEELYKEELGHQKDRLGAVFEKSSSKKDEENKKKGDVDDNQLQVDSFLDSFNVDDFLKLDVGLNDETTSGSKFSRWFKRESPTSAAAALANNAAAVNSMTNNRDHHQLNDSLFNNIINDLETTVSIPNNEPQHLFAPISPAASTNPASASAPPTHNSLLEMLRRGQPNNPPSSMQAFQQQHKLLEQNIPMKMHCLEELEAHVRGPVHQQQKNNNQHPPGQSESIAFKKLMEQMFEGHAVPATNGPMMQNQQPMSILQMLNKSQQADQAILEAQHHHQQQQQQPDLLYKLLHMNQEKVMPGNINRNYQISPIPNDMPPHMNNMQRDLLQRPEAMAIIQGLKQGEITPQHLMQQMGNPALQGRHREVINTILKLHQQQPPPQQQSPRTRLILPPQPVQQQLRISPLPPNAYCVSPIMATSPNTLAVHHPAIPQRIPSPRELQAHTQSIMQGALIKKKLEEQRENFRRRQEQAATSLAARTTTPAPVVSPSKHPATLAFTPTSVLRKMTAEKDVDHVLPKAAGWGAPPMHTQQTSVPKHGRPIVKGNNAGPNMSQFQGNPEYPNSPYINQHPQQYTNNVLQQQAAAVAAARNKAGHQSHHQFHAMVMQMQRQQQQQQQQQLPHSQPMQVNRNQMTGNLQQLLVHPQRNHNEGVSMGPALSPTSNQLARWFSPELLAQATAGKLPSVNMAQNVLSLEELERMQHSEAIVHN